MAKKSLEERIRRLEDAQEIANLMSVYEYKLSAGLLEEGVNCFALKTPGVRAELGPWGVYEGPEGIKKLYLGVHSLLQLDSKTGKSLPGVIFVQANANPVIEVAGDGKTAKGLWICVGYAAIPFEGNKRQARWFGAKRAADFIKEDGKWKIWHYHVYGQIDNPYDTSWVDYQEPGPVADFRYMFPDELKADKPTTYHKMYGPTYSAEYVPAAPEPYETWEKTISY